MVMNNKDEKLLKSDEILVSLKQRYFGLASEENYPKTKEITKTLDKLEIAIRQRTKELLNGTRTPQEI